MDEDETAPEHRPVKDAHKTLGLWSIRRALTFAFAAAVVLLVAAWFLLLWLLGSPPHAKPKPLETRDLLELLKLVFALVAGVGALVALVTAYRRQRVDEAAGERAERVQAHVEQVARDAAHDATERLVTDLYGQAVGLLGHDKAAVRLGGLYSLERLAQNHPQHRQTVTDVVCAYLRMPFRPPLPNTSQQEPESNTHQDPADDDARQELQVRLTAQRLLQRHLTIIQLASNPAMYWENIDIDLTGAHLIDFDFTNCCPAGATFTNAYFIGDTRFGAARFAGRTVFGGARFNGTSYFSAAQFSANADFRGTRFDGYMRFRTVEFDGDADFGAAQFSGGADFRAAQFRGDALFEGGRFGGDAMFNEANIGGLTVFCGTRFDRRAEFCWAQFKGRVRFDGNAVFGAAQFGGDADFHAAKFGEEADFRGARFGGKTKFNAARFVHAPTFRGATVKYPNDAHEWPSPWHAEASGAGTARLIDGN
ncbi:pentapeptide repeat-containing protein [Actinomadura sp. NEAU-AAG7]|uniref:pentapeptide repeat-containing protein n=1 Tax=Actinomadura sp. NEAU-AAG7 TaxID=2839640 RepID=UPI001BE423A3|nr:pentapeptide repeat-containing protein [Actinomadura sp. NEAU-AAG7]MBT2212883.1 pentapeptide repeat-containing protein [Actinomadura sp. NEAU-AAG7]